MLLITFLLCKIRLNLFGEGVLLILYLSSLWVILLSLFFAFFIFMSVLNFCL